MFEFVLVNVLMVSLGTLLYLIARSLPRLGEDPSAHKPGILDRWAHSEIPERVDAALNAFLEKLLRRLKVVLLKVDNTLAEHLKKVKPSNGGEKQPIDFKEIAAEKNGNGSPSKQSTEVRDIT